MTDEISTSDVLTELDKNLCNLYTVDVDQNEDEIGTNVLTDNEYYTECDFIDFLKASNFSKTDDLLILSLNIANLLSKLSSLKNFLTNISAGGCKPDIIVVVETHISEQCSHGPKGDDLTNIIPGYTFFHRGRANKKGGGVGILVSNDLDTETKILTARETGLDFMEEKFQPGLVD